MGRPYGCYLLMSLSICLLLNCLFDEGYSINTYLC